MAWNMIGNPFGGNFGNPEEDICVCEHVVVPLHIEKEEFKKNRFSMDSSGELWYNGRNVKMRKDKFVFDVMVHNTNISVERILYQIENFSLCRTKKDGVVMCWKNYFLHSKSYSSSYCGRNSSDNFNIACLPDHKLYLYYTCLHSEQRRPNMQNPNIFVVIEKTRDENSVREYRCRIFKSGKRFLEENFRLFHRSTDENDIKNDLQRFIKQRLFVISDITFHNFLSCKSKVIEPPKSINCIRGIPVKELLYDFVAEEKISVKVRNYVSDLKSLAGHCASYLPNEKAEEVIQSFSRYMYLIQTSLNDNMDWFQVEFKYFPKEYQDFIVHLYLCLFYDEKKIDNNNNNNNNSSQIIPFHKLSIDVLKYKIIPFLNINEIFFQSFPEARLINTKLIRSKMMRIISEKDKIILSNESSLHTLSHNFTILKESLNSFPMEPVVEKMMDEIGGFEMEKKESEEEEDQTKKAVSISSAFGKTEGKPKNNDGLNPIMYSFSEQRKEEIIHLLRTWNPEKCLPMLLHLFLKSIYELKNRVKMSPKFLVDIFEVVLENEEVFKNPIRELLVNEIYEELVTQLSNLKKEMKNETIIRLFNLLFKEFKLEMKYFQNEYIPIFNSPRVNDLYQLEFFTILCGYLESRMKNSIIDGDLLSLVTKEKLDVVLEYVNFIHERFNKYTFQVLRKTPILNKEEMLDMYLRLIRRFIFGYTDYVIYKILDLPKFDKVRLKYSDILYQFFRRLYSKTLFLSPISFSNDNIKKKLDVLCNDCLTINDPYSRGFAHSKSLGFFGFDVESDIFIFAEYFKNIFWHSGWSILQKRNKESIIWNFKNSKHPQRIKILKKFYLLLFQKHEFYYVFLHIIRNSYTFSGKTDEVLKQVLDVSKVLFERAFLLYDIFIEFSRIIEIEKNKNEDYEIPILDLEKIKILYGKEIQISNVFLIQMNNKFIQGDPVQDTKLGHLYSDSFFNILNNYIVKITPEVFFEKYENLEEGVLSQCRVYFSFVTKDLVKEHHYVVNYLYSIIFDNNNNNNIKNNKKPESPEIPQFLENKRWLKSLICEKEDFSDLEVNERYHLMKYLVTHETKKCIKKNDSSRVIGKTKYFYTAFEMVKKSLEDVKIMIHHLRRIKEEFSSYSLFEYCLEIIPPCVFFRHYLQNIISPESNLDPLRLSDHEIGEIFNLLIFHFKNLCLMNLKDISNEDKHNEHTFSRVAISNLMFPMFGILDISLRIRDQENDKNKKPRITSFKVVLDLLVFIFGKKGLLRDEDTKNNNPLFHLCFKYRMIFVVLSNFSQILEKAILQEDVMFLTNEEKKIIHSIKNYDSKDNGDNDMMIKEMFFALDKFQRIGMSDLVEMCLDIVTTKLNSQENEDGISIVVDFHETVRRIVKLRINMFNSLPLFYEYLNNNNKMKNKDFSDMEKNDHRKLCERSLFSLIERYYKIIVRMNGEYTNYYIGVKEQLLDTVFWIFTYFSKFQEKFSITSGGRCFRHFGFFFGYELVFEKPCSSKKEKKLNLVPLNDVWKEKKIINGSFEGSLIIREEEEEANNNNNSIDKSKKEEEKEFVMKKYLKILIPILDYFTTKLRSDKKPEINDKNELVFPELQNKFLYQLFKKTKVYYQDEKDVVDLDKPIFTENEDIIRDLYDFMKVIIKKHNEYKQFSEKKRDLFNMEENIDSTLLSITSKITKEDEHFETRITDFFASNTFAGVVFCILQKLKFGTEESENAEINEFYRNMFYDEILMPLVENVGENEIKLIAINRCDVEDKFFKFLYSPSSDGKKTELLEVIESKVLGLEDGSILQDLRTAYAPKKRKDEMKKEDNFQFNFGVTGSENPFKIKGLDTENNVDINNAGWGEMDWNVVDNNFGFNNEKKKEENEEKDRQEEEIEGFKFSFVGSENNNPNLNSNDQNDNDSEDNRENFNFDNPLLGNNWKM